MDLHILIREYDPKTEQWKTLFDETDPVPEKMSRNHALHWMLAKLTDIFPDDRPSRKYPYDPTR